MSNFRQSKTTPSSMDSGPTSRFRTARNMPSWVTESSDRVGPPPPPPPIIPTDPEYEVIDVANQQYSNAPPPVPLKSPDIKRLTVMKCDLCGSVTPIVRCEQCDSNLFCASCDDRYHRHPKRQTHARKPIEPPPPAPSTVKPPLPPKGEGGVGGPLPPPRKNKRPGSFHFPSPMLGRKQDQTIPTTVPQGQPEQQQQKPPPPPPSPALSLREKMNSLKRFIHPSNRPLPDPPENKIHSSNSSLDTVSKRSPSGGMSRAVSTTMEKIQNNTAATLDRMTLLQQRYRQHQETMKSGDGDRSRRASLTSNTDLQSSATESSNSFRSRPTSGSFQQSYQQQQQQQQQHHQFLQTPPHHPGGPMHQPQLQSRWLNPPAPRIRSGSVASGINLLPGAPPGTPHGLTANNAPPPSVSPTQRSEFGDSPPMMPNAPRSTSVFNLHQPPPQQQPNMWGFNPLHQAQSMAHFNPMQWNQMNAWMARGSQNGSNMSLNLPSPSPHGFPQDPSGYPPAWTNAWGGMYPYPMGMMPMMPGVAMPPPRSRANSRSRAASPALSVKSRKSTMSMRNLNRNSFIDDLTDDEDSDDEFHRARDRGSDRRRRERLNSTSSIDFDEPEPNQAFVRASSVKHSRFNRDRRGGGSSARSLIDYPVSRKPAAARYDREELTRDRFDKMALASPRKTPSDSFTNESEPEQEGKRRGSAAMSGRAARSSNDGFSSPRKVTSDSLTNDSDADFERRRQAKLRAAQNNLAVSTRRPTSDSLTNDSDLDHERRRQAGKANKPVVAAPSKKQSSDSDGRDKPHRKTSTDSRASGGKHGAPAPVPEKIPSDSHTPDTDGEQKRRFATKQQRQRKHSSTEFIANDSDDQEQTRAPAAGKKSEAALAPARPTQVVNGLLEFRTISPSKSDSDEQRHLKTVEIKNIINEDDSRLEADFGRSVLEDSPPPPAPVAPSCEWQCEFCTYVNEPGVKICAICCKTATMGVVGSGAGASKQDHTQSRSPPPDVVQEAPHVTEVKLQIVPPQKQVNGKPTSPTEAKKKDDAGRSDVDDEDEDHEMDTGMTVVGVGKPGGGGGFAQQGHMVTAESAGIKKEEEVVATLVENKVARAKVSTGCGPSPPREIDGEPKRATVPVVDRPGSKASTGTSPPSPQDMSTQTYDTLEQIREEIAALEQTADKPINRTDEEQTQQHQQHDQNIASSLYKRSYSLATPQLLQVDRPASRNSISSDTQSLPPSPHELSPQPGLQSSTRFQANTALNQTSHPNPSTPSSSSSAHYGQQQDETLSYLDRAIHQIIQTAANESRVTAGAGAGRPTVDDSKYRTVSDLRRIAEQPSVKVATVQTITKGQMQPKKSMPPTTMDDQIDPEETVQERREPSLVQNGAAKGEQPESEMTLLLREAERYQFTAEELQAALTHCGEKHPVQWLRGNWNKLIETVQTLATKYGHEKRENTIGTISTTEAREALRQHRGNIWRAITECIEQRQRKYREIAKQGNFTREDIVTSLTAHHGNLEQAMVELSKTQLKPFLMRIWGPPNGADNDSGNLPLLQQALREDRSGINSDIQEFISAHVEQELLGEGCADKPSVTEETPATIAEEPERIEEPEEQAEPEIAALTSRQDADQREEVCAEQPTNSSNTEILKDIEALIQQMERNQESTNAPVLRNIQQLLTQLVQADQEPHGSRSPSVTSVRSQASDQRIMSKSPIPVVRPSTTIQHQAHPTDRSNRTIEDDVRDFVEQNIQDILPNLVQQVRQELDSVHEDLRTKPTRTLEDDIRETLLNADYSDSDYSNMHYFPFEKPNDPSAVFPERQTTTVKEVTSQNGPVMVEDEQEYVNIQQFLQRAIKNERTTTAFDRYKRRNYQIDSSSDEARQTAESTDYYDLVSINEKLMSLFNKPPSKEHEKPEADAQTIAQPAEVQAKETIVVQAVREHVLIAKVDTEQSSLPATSVIEKIETLPTVEVATEKKGMKKRRGSRVPMNKNNYLSRRPVKSSSESDFEGLAHNAKPNTAAVVAIDHVEELRHVVENIERIERTVEAEDVGNEMERVDLPVDVQETEEPIYINLPPKPEPVVGEESSQPVPESVPSNSTQIENDDLPSIGEKRQQEMVVSVPEETLAQVEEHQLEQEVAPVEGQRFEQEVAQVEEQRLEQEVAQVEEQRLEQEVAQVEEQQPVQEVVLPVTEELQESLQPLEATTNDGEIKLIAPIESLPVENGVDSPKNITQELQVNDVQNEEAQDEVLVHSAKLSNNLSELVLDTKRLIQQMKDEINSDIATFNEDDAAYEDDFYEDEYEDEWEGEEEEEDEEWDSNEEYDVDENGDFLEYEDDDDDGSVMFSEATIIDSTNGKSRSVEQSQHTEELEPVPEPLQEMILPKINLAVVRENERNSASEVSDLPLDSDFNDALSVIEHSVSEMRNMLQLTEEALGPLPGLTGSLQHASSVETLQNSPEQSEISEMTLVPDADNGLPGATEESSEQTLVAEENQPMTMKEVQTLLNAKAVIGGFLKNVQQIEQIIEETIEPVLDPVELPEINATAPVVNVIYDSVRTTSTEATDNKPASVIERNVAELHDAPAAPVFEQTTEISEAQNISPQESHNGTNESLSNEDNTHPAPETQMSTEDATEHTVLQSSSTLAPVAVILDEPKEGPVENVVQTLRNAVTASNNTEPITRSDANGIQEDNLQHEAAYVPPAVEIVSPEEYPSITDNVNQNISETNDRTSDTQTTMLAESTEPEEFVTPEYVNVSVLQTMDTAESLTTTPDYATVIKAGSQMQVVENESNDEHEVQHPTLPSHARDTENGLDLEAHSVPANKSPEQNGSTTQNSLVVHPQAAVKADESGLILSQNTQVRGEIKTAVGTHGSIPTESVELEALTSTESSSSGQQNSIVEQNQQANKAPPVDHPSEPSPIVTNGFANIAPAQPKEPSPGTITKSYTSRASSEEPSSSFVEVQPSQVIVHSPHPSPPEAPPRTTNIYQNVDILPPVATTKSPSVRKKASSKLTVKITNANTLQSDDGASPTTPPTPTGSKANAKASKTTKTDAKKKSTGNTTPTTATTTADSSGRKQSIVRKKSIGSPFGTVQTNTVKAMQKEFLSKAKESPKPSTSKVSPKPSKLVQPKLFSGGRTSSSPAAGSSKASTPASDGGASSSRSTPGLGANEPGPSSSYTCEKMLKKKYRETCFSDDYQTTDDEDESRMTITESERTIIKSLVKPYEPDSDPPEVQAKKILDDGLVQNFTQAELAVQLIELRYARDSAIWAATQCHTVDEAKDLLQKECELCLGVFPMNEIVSMLKCTHTCCLECAKEYFTQEIGNRSITNCNCPYCKEPDLNGPDVTEDDVLEYFSNLDILLKSIVDETVHDLFQRKIRDRTLTQDPNFKWCVHCSSGFFARPKQRRLTCPDCGSITCASCRKPWESQHEGLSCEKYAEWKEANDPELQAEGVQRHLQTHGISCPNCKFRYSLARGGCMHFTCTQCKFEFCYGCNKPFMMGAKCSVSPYCAKLGLHAHHPRNCLFYLRDKEPRDLQNLLLMNNVPFDTEPSEAMKQEQMNGQNSIPKCPIPLQKETPAGLMDMICSAEVPEKHAGLCRAHYIEYLSFLVTTNSIDPIDILNADDLESIVRRANKRMPPRPYGTLDGIYREFLTHYVEYLVGTVSKAQIDPLPILDLTDCVQELRRRGIPLPERGPWDTDPIYREMCQKIVKDQIPLNN